MNFLSSSIGRKIVMAVTGLIMVLFAVVHLIGNTTIFGWINGGINAYAEHLHAFPPLVCAFRAVMLVTLAIHVWFGIQLTLENREGRSRAYAVKSTQKTTFASENMIWTGVFILAFIVYHLLHFTVRAVPGMTLITDAHGAINVFAMVVSSFQGFFTALIYAVAMVMLFLHLSHGIQSFFQTMGWNNERTLPSFVKAATLVALVLFLGYVAIPLSIFSGILKG